MKWNKIGILDLPRMAKFPFHLYFAWIVFAKMAAIPIKRRSSSSPETACTMSYCQRDTPWVKHASTTKKKEDGTRRKKKKKKKRKRRNKRGKVSLVSIARRHRWRRMKEKGLSGKVFSIRKTRVRIIWNAVRHFVDARARNKMSRHVTFLWIPLIGRESTLIRCSFSFLFFFFFCKGEQFCKELRIEPCRDIYVLKARKFKFR